MKKFVLPILGLLMLLLSGCNKPGDNILSFGAIPAIVGFDYTMFRPTLMTSSGTLLASDMNDANMQGNAVLAYFDINYDKQPNQEYITASVLGWYVVGKELPQYGEAVADDADIPIFNMDKYDEFEYDNGRYVIFFNFEHYEEDLDGEISYEMFYNLDEETDDDIPVVYVKARKTGNAKPNFMPGVYAFEMTYYLMNIYEKKMFNIKFKKGVVDGKDVYENWSENPFRPLFFDAE